MKPIVIKADPKDPQSFFKALDYAFRENEAYREATRQLKLNHPSEFYTLLNQARGERDLSLLTPKELELWN